MAKYSFGYFILKEGEVCFESEAAVSLTKKDFAEMEQFIIDHDYSCEFMDIPGRIYDKCRNEVMERALREFPDCAHIDKNYEFALESYIPESFVEQLSEETANKITDAINEQIGDDVEEVEEEEEDVAPTKENSLYLTIKQTYFDQIVAGTKDKEYREIKDTTYKKYLLCDEEGYPYIRKDAMNEDDPWFGDILAWNNGEYPFIPVNYKYLNLAVGYNKERDTATVKVVGISFEPVLNKIGKPARFNDDGVKISIDENGPLCFWQIVYHLGEVVELHRK